MAKIEFTKLSLVSNKPVTYFETPMTIETDHIRSYYPVVYGNKYVDNNATVIVISSTLPEEILLAKGSYTEIKQLIEQTNNPQP